MLRCPSCSNARSANHPAAIAAECGQEQLTYAELNRRANQVAHYLRGLKVAANDCVGLFVDRSLDMLIGMLGILKAGAAYVPLAPGTPASRIAYMLEASQAPIVLSQASLREQLPAYDGQLLCLDDDWNDQIAAHSESDLPPIHTPRDLAYTIFTSGSTGTPKGVQIEHRSVVNFLTSMQREPGMSSADVLLAVTTLSFDISVLEFFLPLSVGARVVILSADEAADGMRLAETLTRVRPTIMQATPATWRLLVDAGWVGDPGLKILCGGEQLPRDLADRLLKRCGSLWNMYGPTETTIWSTVDRVTADAPISLGHPIANTQIYLLDEQMEPVPIGVPADLYIGGAGLARGYLNQPELTAEKFVPHPFATAAGERLYQTGDLARYRADGSLEFLGRSDFQVKIRGFRIELGEIENRLNAHPDIRQAVVTARQTGVSVDAKQLVAYVVPAGDTRPNLNEIRDYLRQELPEYMLPTYTLWLDALPLNPAGKVDRKALPAPDASRPVMEAPYVAPRNPAETSLAEVWQTVLGIDDVGVHDNFFDLGGASIQSLECAALAEQAGLSVTPALLFAHPTIAELAEAVGAEATSQPVETTAGEGFLAVPAPRPAPVVDPAATPKRVARPLPRVPLEIKKINTVIESMGVYLPPKEVSSKEILDGCTTKIWFPLQKMTGIKSRRMAGEDEFAIDLATKAVQICLDNSQHDVDDIELLIACNIVRTDKYYVVSIEPNTTSQLKARFGFKNAIAFDITNACTGMFTAMQIAQAYITTGRIRRAMVVSGEFITDITRTAQKEICEFMDPRLACLTVGDAGAAIILEEAANKDVGFHELEMYSLCKYSRMCIGSLTDQPHGGPIMRVPNPMEHTAVAVKHSVSHARHMFEKSPWSPEQIDQLIMHQTSDRSLREGKRAINKTYKKKICTDSNTINNLAQRGNTASTAHMVAVWDNIFNGRIKTGDNVVFGITGSGQTIGTGIYTFDDLPDRIRRQASGGAPRVRESAADPRPADAQATHHVCVHSLGQATADEGIEADTFALSAAAAERCLAASDYDRSDIELLIFTGMLRTGYISEPAIATMIGGDLHMNEVIESEDDKKTFAFDVYNGALGTLNALQVATNMLQAGLYRTAMVVAAEIEQNKSVFPDDLFGIREAASAVILDAAGQGQRGFGRFEFRHFPELIAARHAEGYYRDGKPYADLRVDPEIESLYLKCVPETVGRLLSREGLDIEDIGLLLPPQFSSAFNRELATLLGMDPASVVDVVKEGEDLFTSAVPFALQEALARKRATPATSP